MPAVYVPGMGNPNAKILICGEAPGEEEEKRGEPFVGSSGNLLNEILKYGGIERKECYITNICKYRPPHNDIKKLNLIGHSIEECLPQLYEEIRAINPNIIFGLGDIALKYLTGETGITTYRGSILSCRETGHKTVCSIHPAAILHAGNGSTGSYSDLFLIKQDACRVQKQAAFPEIKRPDRSISLIHSSTQLERFLERNKRNEPNKEIDHSKYIPEGSRRVVLDVETFKTYPVCIGLAFNSWDAASIALFHQDQSMSDRCYIWEILVELLANENTLLIGQNAKFDYKRCRQIGMKWKNGIYFDIMQAWHTLGFSEIRKDLATVCSVLTEEPYYKSEGKEYDWRKHDFSKLMRYNAKDAYTEWECYERLHEMLVDQDMEEFFFEKVCPLNGLYTRIEDIGIKVDVEKRKILSGLYTKKIVEKEEQFIACLELATDKDTTEAFSKRNKEGHLTVYNSTGKMCPELLYGVLKIPLRQDTGEDTLKALVNNTIKDPVKKKIVNLILELRKLGKAKNTYVDYELIEI